MACYWEFIFIGEWFYAEFTNKGIHLWFVYESLSLIFFMETKEDLVALG